jgi:hypothetical protein
MESHIQTMLDKNRDIIRNAVREVSESDRDYIKNLQKSNHQQYRNQRKTPQVIIPETDHKDGGSIEMENAPMTHPAVAFTFRDAQYSTLSEARQLMDKGFALKARITTDPHTKVIPKGEAPWRQEATYAPEPHKQDASDRHSSHMPVPAPPTRGSTRPRLPLDQQTAMTEDYSMDQGSSSVSPPPTNRPITSPYSGRSGEKGKRSAPYQGDRRLPPQKFARSDQYPPPRTYDTY